MKNLQGYQPKNSRFCIHKMKLRGKQGVHIVIQGQNNSELKLKLFPRNLMNQESLIHTLNE